MAMLAYDDRAAAAPLRAPAAAIEPGQAAEPDEEIQERWLQSLPWPRRWFARFYRALRKLQPMFPPMSCC